MPCNCRDSIDGTELRRLRDRALIGVMVYSFARVSAAATLRIEDYFENGKRAWRLHEKGGRAALLHLLSHISCDRYHDVPLVKATIPEQASKIVTYPYSYAGG
jgi:integrase/recombinase XerD